MSSDRRARSRNCDGTRRRDIDSGFCKICAGCKSPCTIDERANTVPGTRRIGQRRDDAVAHLDAFGSIHFETDIRVSRTAANCAVECAGR
jgi:hypothetical protein